MNENILQEFKQYLYEIGYSKGTQRSILFCVKEFSEQINKAASIIVREDIRCFYEYLQERPLKRGTGVLSQSMVNHYLFSIKVFFNWLEQTEQIAENPTSNINFKRPKSKSREPLTQSEIQQLFNATENIKESVILHLFYSCGLRRTEAVNLNTSDIHFAKNVLYVRNGKGAKRRAIPINESVKQDFESYLLHRENPKSIEAFVINEQYNRMSGNSYNALLQKIAGRCQLPTETCTLHHLRHSIATHLLENGMSIEFVRDFLGHKHLEATQIYVKVSRQMVSGIKT